MAVAAEARRDRALLLAERVGGDAVVGVVERREAVRGRRPLRGDVLVAADAVAAADGRARVEPLARDLGGDLVVARPLLDAQRDADVAVVRLEAGQGRGDGADPRAMSATPATTIATLTPQIQRASRLRAVMARPSVAVAACRRCRAAAPASAPRS